MHAQTRMDMVGIKDYYKMTLINENVYWMKPTHLLSSFSQNVRVPFCTSTFTSNDLFKMYTLEREKCHSLMYTMYTNVSNITPSYTHDTLYVV
jgi:hypothetical protein